MKSFVTKCGHTSILDRRNIENILDIYKLITKYPSVKA